MPSVNADIRLQATGADEAVSQIEKLKSAFEKTAKQAQMLANSAANIGKTLGSMQPAEVSQFLQSSAARHETGVAVYDRGRREIERSRSRGASAPAIVGAASSASVSLARGDFGGAAATSIGGASSLMAALGPVGIAMAVGAAAIKTMSDFAKDEQMRVGMIYGSGMNQRLGSKYSDIRQQVLDIAGTGVPMGMVMQLYSAMSNSGMRMNDIYQKAAYRASDMAANYGVSPDVMGQYLGSLSQANVGMAGNTSVVGRGIYGLAGMSFGTQNMNSYFSTLTQVQNQQYASGLSSAAASTGQTWGNAQTLAGLAMANGGGLTAPGASAAMQQIMGAGSKMSSMSSPYAVMILQGLMSGKVTGTPMSINDAMAWMDTHQNEDVSQLYKIIEGQGGSQTYRQQVFSGVTGMNMAMTQAYYRMSAAGTSSTSSAAAKAYAENNMPIPDAGQGNSNPRLTTAVHQLNLFGNVQQRLNAFENATVVGAQSLGLMGGGRGLSASDFLTKQQNAVISGGISNIAGPVKATATAKDVFENQVLGPLKDSPAYQAIMNAPSSHEYKDLTDAITKLTDVFNKLSGDQAGAGTQKQTLAADARMLQALVNDLAGALAAGQ